MSRKNFLGLIVLCASVCLGTACSGSKSSGNDPQDRLKEYISTSFKAQDSKDRYRMTEFLTGGAKNRLLAWSDEQFREAFIENRRQFQKLAIREVKKLNADEANVTYELTYLDPAKGSEALVTNKRMAEMILSGGKWYIREVHNIKELIEYRNEMSL